MKKKTEVVSKTNPAPQGAERFTFVLENADDYPMYSVHEFGGVKYKVVAILQHDDGLAVEFVRMN